MKAVIFDLDGVIADTDRTRFELLQDLLARRGIKIPDSDYKKTIGTSTMEILHDACQALLSEREIEEVYHERQREYYQHPEKYVIAQPGAVETVKALAKKYPLGIASASDRAAIETVVHYLKIADCFAVIVGKDEVMKPKPAPDVYVEALLRFGVDPSEAVVVEDSPNGIHAAKAAGLYTIAVTHSHDHGELHEADKIIHSLKDLPQIITTFK